MIATAEAAVDTFAWADVATMVITLLVGVLGGGGFMAWRVNQSQIEEQRANYWKHEMQTAYARALAAMFTLDGYARSIDVHVSKGMEYTSLASMYDDAFSELENIRSVIELLASVETRAVVNDYMNDARLFWLIVVRRPEDYSEAEEAWRSAQELAFDVQDRFRLDLGLKPVFTDEHSRTTRTLSMDPHH